MTLRLVWFDRSLSCALLLTKLSQLSISIKNVGVTSGILGTRICTGGEGQFRCELC